MRSTLAVVVLALCVVGCPKKEEPAAPVAPKQAEATPTPPAAPDVVDAGADAVDETGLQYPDAGWMADAGTSDATAVKLFETSCSVTFAAGFDDMGEGGIAPECWAQDFDQNCAADVFGCWDKLEKCRDACAPVCDTCQSACAGTCSDCKKTCAGKDASCVTTCAKARQSCRLACVSKLPPCRAQCITTEKSCEVVGEAQLKKDCPACESIRKCQADEKEDCKKKFPKAAAKCFEQCYDE